MKTTSARATTTTLAALALACVGVTLAARGDARAQPQEGVPAQTREGAPKQTREAVPAPEDAPPPAEPGRSAVYGRAVNEATNRPLRRARIMLMMVGGARVDQADLTNARGEFRVANLPAGRYIVWADVEGMVSPAAFYAGDPLYDPEELTRLFTVVELDGKADREVSVRARRGGAITGRVTYADGDPAVGVSVHLMRRRGRDGPPLPVLTSTSRPTALRTDDRGVYRIAGLPPGDYFIAVAEPADHAGTGRQGSFEQLSQPDLFFHNQILTTYHPASLSLKGAEPVAVRAGEESEGVDVRIPDRELRTLKGVVRARGGQPVAGAKVNIAPRDDEVGGDRPFLDLMDGATADAEGRWQLQEIPDGLYTILVRAPAEHEVMTEEAMAQMMAEAEEEEDALQNHKVPGRDPKANRPPKLAPVLREVRVASDVDGLVFELSEGARIAGTVVFEGGKAAPYLYVVAQRVAKNVAELVGDGTAGSQIEDGAFELEGLPPGKYYLHAREFSETDNFYVKAITWQGRDLLREPVEVGEGTRVEGVRVVVANDPANLEVRVRRAGGEPAHGLSVFLLPADLSRWSLFMSPLACAVEGGSCEISAPPGEYFVVAAPLATLYPDPEPALRRLAPTAPRVTLRPGEEKSFEVVVR